jgi:hypothetical protein
MTEFDKYICTTLHKRHLLPGPTPEQRDQLAADGLRIRMEHIFWIDSDVIPGAYYGEATWIWPESYPGQITPEELAKRTTPIKPMFPHAHSFPELLSWWGSDPDNPQDTSEMAMIMGDEEITLDNSWVAYIPAGMMHMPKWVPNGRTTEKPVNHWTFGPGFYTRYKNGEEVKDEEAEAQKEYKTVPGKKDNLKYFVFGGQQKNQNIIRPSYMGELDPRYVRPMAYIDDTIIPDAELGCDTMYLLPGDTSKSGQLIMDAHTLPHGTFIAMTAVNYDDITDLAAEVELWIGGEKHIINKTFGAYIPPNVEQGPLIIRNITKQVFFNMAMPVGKGIERYAGG